MKIVSRPLLSKLKSATAVSAAFALVALLGITGEQATAYNPSISAALNGRDVSVTGIGFPANTSVRVDAEFGATPVGSTVKSTSSGDFKTVIAVPNGFYGDVDITATAKLSNKDGDEIAVPANKPKDTAKPYPLGDSNTNQATPSKTLDCSNEEKTELKFTSKFTGSSGREIPYGITLPASYYESCKQYPVLYSLHGQGDSYENFLEFSQVYLTAIDAGVLPEVIIVTPDSFATGEWEDTDLGPAESNFINELIPFIEKNYRAAPGSSNRLLTGFSMGGHGAFYYGMKHPDLFPAVYAVDPALKSTGQYTQYAEKYKAEGGNIMAVGGTLCGESAKNVIDALKPLGVEINYVDYGLDHSLKLFLKADQENGWPAMKMLSASLGNTTS